MKIVTAVLVVLCICCIGSGIFIFSYLKSKQKDIIQKNMTLVDGEVIDVPITYSSYTPSWFFLPKPFIFLRNTINPSFFITVSFLKIRVLDNHIVYFSDVKSVDVDLDRLSILIMIHNNDRYLIRFDSISKVLDTLYLLEQKNIPLSQSVKNTLSTEYGRSINDN